MRCDLSAMTSNAQNKIRWDHFLVRNETDYAATPRSSLSTPLYDVEYCWWHMLLGTSTRTLEFFEARAPQHHHHRPCVGITATGAINRAAVVTIVQSRTIISFFLVVYGFEVSCLAGRIRPIHTPWLSCLALISVASLNLFLGVNCTKATTSPATDQCYVFCLLLVLSSQLLLLGVPFSLAAARWSCRC